MHELTITQSILDISLQAAQAQHAQRIRAIRLTMGPFSGVVPECVQMYLDVLAKGTIAEGAKIEARTLPPAGALPRLRAGQRDRPPPHRLPVLRRRGPAAAFGPGISGR